MHAWLTNDAYFRVKGPSCAVTCTIPETEIMSIKIASSFMSFIRDLVANYIVYTDVSS